MASSKKQSKHSEITPPGQPEKEQKLLRPWFSWSKFPPLSVTHPNLAAQWHPTRNGFYTADDYTFGSAAKIWWKCPAGEDHVWRRAINIRTESPLSTMGCPFCSGKLPSKNYNIAVSNPELMSEWHPSKNGPLNPEKFTPGSSRKVWWLCRKDPSHTWKASCLARTVQKTACPFCSSRKLTISNSLAGRFPELAREWHPTKNGELRPEEIFPFGKIKIWWRCSLNAEHIWRQNVTNRTRKNLGCPHCAGNATKFGRVSLKERFPKVAAEWHPTLNGSLKPEDVPGCSVRVVWWLCSLNPKHTWQCKVERRTIHNAQCKACIDEGKVLRRLPAKEQSLGYLFPEIAAEWHKLRNDGFSPFMFSPGSQRYVWWQCPVKAEHEYQAKISNRTRKERPQICQFCAGDRVDTENSIAALHPSIAAEWHPTLNEKMKPNRVACGSSKLYWWRCKKDKTHQWMQSASNRIRTPECPFCSDFYISDSNSLASKFPTIALEWHPTKNRRLWPKIAGSYKIVRNLRIPTHKKLKNRRLRPSDLAYNSKESVWWRCRAAKHEWRETVEARTLRHSNCPECKNNELVNEKSLAARYPGLAKMWHKGKNKLSPFDVLPGSGLSAWWRCPRCADHIWEATIVKVVESHNKFKSSGCPWCSGLKADQRNSLAALCQRAAKMWHPDKNGGCSASDVTAKSNKNVFWLCPVSKYHDWQARICNVVLAIERGLPGCPFCSGKRFSPERSLSALYPSVAQMWHPTKNGQLKPSQVGITGKVTAFWICKKNIEHVWQAKVSAVVQSYNRGSKVFGCPFCYGKKASRENNLEKGCPEATKYWHPNKNSPAKPALLTPGSNKRMWWRCPTHSSQTWEAAVCNVVNLIKSGKSPCLRCRESKVKRARKN